MEFNSEFDIGQTVWGILDGAFVAPLKVGKIIIEHTDSPGIKDSFFENFKAQKSHKESYMCVETGIGSGSLFTLDKDIFRTFDAAQKALDAFRRK